jgi:hypothetical protein
VRAPAERAPLSVGTEVERAQPPLPAGGALI